MKRYDRSNIYIYKSATNRKTKMITFILHTCDDYEFCWKGSLHYLDKHFKEPMPRLFCNEEKDVALPEGWQQFKTGKGAWSDRLKIILDYVTTPYVVYCQEDFWPFRDIDSGAFNSALHVMPLLGLAAAYICKLDFNHCKMELITNEAYRFEPGSNYIHNHQFAIWNKEALLLNLGDCESPWTNEVTGTERVKQRGDHYLYMATNFNWYNAVVRHGVMQPIGIQMLKEIC